VIFKREAIKVAIMVVEASAEAMTDLPGLLVLPAFTVVWKICVMVIFL
jgi:hypothetical protein